MTDTKVPEVTPIEVDNNAAQTNEVNDINEEKILFEWVAPDRAFQKREKDFWITAIAILVLVAVIFIFIKEFFLIIALGSLLFLFYVLSSVPPTDVKYTITNRGVYFGEAHYYWNILERFWFKKQLSTDMIHFGTNIKFPRSVSFVIKPEDQDTLKSIIVKRLPLVESPPTIVDNITEWFAKRLPLESRSEKTKKLRTEEKKS